MTGLKKKVLLFIKFQKRSLQDLGRGIQQRIYFKRAVDKRTKRLIVFLIEGPWIKGMTEYISGGITSIESIYQRTREFKSIHCAEAVLCVLNGHRQYRFTTFDSISRIIHYDQLQEFRNLDEVLFHIPEYLLPVFEEKLKSGQIQKSLKAKSYRLNILNQNIEKMPAPKEVEKLKPYFKSLTQTTAHRNYHSSGFLDKYNFPYHFFSARIDISQYQFVPFKQKEDLIVFSLDDMEKDERVISILKSHFPTYRFQIIQNLSYAQYKKLIGKAKFCFTFGEGLDGYFVESFFSGTVCFAVYNNRFFSSTYKDLPSLFSSEEQLFLDIVKRVAQFLQQPVYASAVEQTNKVLTAEYNYKEYVNNIKCYYSTYFAGEC